MKTSSTLNQLIAFLYEESDSKEINSVKEDIKNDPTIRERFDSLLKLKKELNKINYEPSQACINNILSYSKKHKNN